MKGADEEVEVDIDELLDMDSDDQRRKHLEVTSYPISLGSNFFKKDDQKIHYDK